MMSNYLLMVYMNCNNDKLIMVNMNCYIGKIFGNQDFI